MPQKIVQIVSLLGILGIPSIFAISAWCVRQCRQLTNRVKILMEAQQAQMRSQLLQQYHYHSEKGWISEDDLEDWENQYQSYHALGKNGVLDKRRDQLLTLPSKPA